MHKTIRITHDTMSADIDELIAPLINLMWKAGIETVESCQESYDGWVAIYFYGVEQPRKFLKIVHAPAQEALDHAATIGENIRIGLPPNKWKMTILPHWQMNHIGFLVSVRFPQSEIGNIFQKLEEYLSNENLL